MTDIRTWAARAAIVVAGMCLWAQTASAAPEAAEESASAGSVPFALAVVPSWEAPSQDWDVVGMRLSLLFGRHRNVSVLDVGLLAGITDCDMYGITAAGIWNSVGGTCVGLQVASVGFAHTFKGLQVGIVNRTDGLTGVQVGVVNYAEQSEGIQLGLVNVMPDGRYPVMPIFNIGF